MTPASTRDQVTSFAAGRLGIGVTLACLSTSCAPELVVGTWTCPPPPSVSGSDGGALASGDQIVDAPWATGFEMGFCDYTRAAGFCYSAPDASFTVVAAPVHGGRAAAAFSVTSDSAKSGTQARCVREGALPQAAVYGAWFYVPSLADNQGNWNLMHFQGGTIDSLHYLWDISLGSAADGSLSLYMVDFLHRRFLRTSDDAALSIPIGSWFHVELRLLRAPDATGEVALYQDGTLLLERTALATDDSDFAQWYVGNFVDALSPADSTVYVDDVTIRGVP